MDWITPALVNNEPSCSITERNVKRRGMPVTSYIRVRGAKTDPTFGRTSTVSNPSSSAILVNYTLPPTGSPDLGPSHDKKHEQDISGKYGSPVAKYTHLERK
jgi:hypothetical protein